LLTVKVSRIADRLSATRFKDHTLPHACTSDNRGKTFVAVHHIKGYLATRLFVALIRLPASTPGDQLYVAVICRPAPTPSDQDKSHNLTDKPVNFRYLAIFIRREAQRVANKNSQRA